MRKHLVSGAPFLLVLLLTGCSLSPLAKHTADFSSATALVVDNSENAFRAAVRLNDQAQASMLVARYDTQPIDPHSLKHLIDAPGLKARTEILDGLRTYAQSLADLAGGISSQPLDDAAAAVGSNLVRLGTAVSSATPIGMTISAQQANAASTALKALGEFLVSQKVRGSVPKIIQEMDPSVDAICKLLLSDIAILRNQAGLDYEQLLMQQDSFIHHAGATLSATERRTEIQRLPRILASQQATDDMLADLEESVKELALAHHALAASASQKDAPSLRARLAELHASGQRLSRYYDSLPTETN
jgi:hypothetical protein